MTDLPIKKNEAFTFYIPGLVSQSNTKTFQTNPTIASGDFKISKDGGAFANPDTLPDVEPDGGTQVRIQLTATEMNADQITLKFQDAAGAEWCDGSLMIFTASAQMADLATASALSTLSGYVDTEVAAIKAKTDNLPSDPADESSIQAAIAAISVPSAASVADAVWDEATSGHVTAGTTGKALSDAGAAGDPWSATTRTLTSTAAETLAAITGSTLSFTRTANYSATLTGMTISASWTKLYLTIKRNKLESDASAQLQLKVENPAAASTDGVLYVNGAAASVGQRTQGSLIVSQAGGTVTLALNDELTALLDPSNKLISGNWYYDIKQVTASGTTVLTAGLVAMSDAVTKAVS